MTNPLPVSKLRGRRMQIGRSKRIWIIDSFTKRRIKKDRHKVTRFFIKASAPRTLNLRHEETRMTTPIKFDLGDIRGFKKEVDRARLTIRAWKGRYVYLTIFIEPSALIQI